MSMIFYPIFLSVYGQLFYHVPVRIIMHHFYTFFVIVHAEMDGARSALGRVPKRFKGGWCGASNHGNAAEFYISQQQAHIQTKGIEALYEWCAASNTPHCFVFIFKIPITSSIVSATWRFPHSDGSMNPASSHAFICARRPS